MSEYWFARRFPQGDARTSMAPVHWKGFAVALAFAAILCAGGVAFAWFGASGRLITGAAIFALCAIFGGFFFISVAQAHGDPERTVADYRKDKLSA